MPHFLSNYGRLTCAQGYFWVTNRPASIWRQITANLVLIGTTDIILLDGIQWTYSSRYHYSVVLWFSTFGLLNRCHNMSLLSTRLEHLTGLSPQAHLQPLGLQWSCSKFPNGTYILCSRQKDTISLDSGRFSGSWKRALTSQCWIWIL